jgi:lysyl-tRNA synthetase, class II
VVNSWEIVKAYSELVDPVEQRELLLEQARLAEAGDEEAMMLDEDFILSMEYGMPIMSGLGLGIDRLLTLLTDAKSIRDVVYFPSLRPMERHEVDGKIVKEEKR